MESPFRPGDLTPDLRLIETLMWDGAGFVRLDLHCARLGRSAGRLGFAHDGGRVMASLDRAVAGAQGPRRVRLTLAADGTAEAVAVPLPATAPQWRIALSPERLDPDDPWLSVKSTRRALYDRTRAALPDGVEEVIFANQRGEIAEGTISNVFFDLGDGLCTPPLACGCLPGCLRAGMLATGEAREAVLRLADLPRARLWVGNSLRGLIPAVLVPSAAPPASSD